MSSQKPRARLRALLGRLTMAAASASAASAAPGLASAATPVPVIPDSQPRGARTPTTAGDDAVHAYPLAISLAHAPPIEAMAMACERALAPESSRRLTLASALTWTFPLVGDDVIIDHLSRDTSPAVRAAAARAAWARRAAGGDPGVLDRLACDIDPSVREVAWLALRGH